ncbi:MAG: sulfatase-like hydrolase/transferase [Chloroflexi bacterium]|nr:sulfatase-like hydrolase/transferase [Chloroflexota bacterium]
MWLNGPQSLALLTAVEFTLFIYIVEEIIFSQPQINSLRRAKGFLEFTTSFTSFILTVLFFYGALVSPLWLKLMYAGFFILVSMVQYGYQRAMGRFAVAGDIEIGIISPPVMWRDSGALYFEPRVFLSILVFLLTLWVVHPLSSWAAGLGSLGVLVLSMILLNILQHKSSYGLNWGPVPIQALEALIEFGRLRLSKSDREQLVFRAELTPTNNLVLIVDESVRGDHLSINGYPRATSPWLEELAKQNGLFHNWGIAVPGATCSNVSNGLMIIGAPIKFGSLEIIYKHPTLFQYAKAMGYRTIYIDVQTPYLWNGIGKDDLKYIDVWIKSTEFGEDKIMLDFLAADRLREIVDGSTGNFIVVNKRGVHYLYENNYPPSAAVWIPTPASPADYEIHADQTANAFDNAILYNVNGFFTRLFPNAAELGSYTANTTYLYTSDHGETLYEDGSRVNHCTGTRHETRVPLIIFGKLPNPVDTTYRASHSNILPTLLDLMNAPAEAHAYPYNLSLLKAAAKDSKDRLFFNSDGTIINHDELEREAEKR